MKPEMRDGPDHLSARENETVTRLKHQIARSLDRVDADAVAREILFKLRMISLGRRAMLADAPEGGGRFPPAEE